MNNILINTAYFPPVQYFTKVNNCTEIWIEQYESYNLPAPDFHSHDFTRNFERHFTTQYIQMQGLYARKSTIEARNMTISSEIGKFLGRNSDLLQIEKGPKRISINMNGKKSPARIWHKTSQL